ncbi:Uncharacterised protein [Mycobacteroides abscessus subsp. abscessus]|nr:Uncharacterised protein [Mycobacteroides abscessus subsp. abscessus]
MTRPLSSGRDLVSLCVKVPLKPAACSFFTASPKLRPWQSGTC